MGMTGNGSAGGAVVGIDLGTTYSSIAWMNGGGHVEVIPNSDGQTTTPSVVFIDGETVLVGHEAAKAALLEPEKSADCFKRDMGRPVYGRRVCGEYMRPEVLAAMVLKKLKQDAEEKIGPISAAVITVPAYFDDTRRRATQDAARMAGLRGVQILNEPTAAALWYGFSRHDQKLDGDGLVLIYDLGGGTFDVTLMRITRGESFEVVATDGDVMLGGKDWDGRLLDHVAGEFMRRMGLDPRADDLAYQELVTRIEESKRSLSKRQAVTIPVVCGGQRLGVTITREELRGLTNDLLARTQTTIELLMSEAGATWAELKRVLVVGGASRMTMVREMIERVAGRPVDTCMDADLAVALGAAVHAARIANVGGDGPAGDLIRRMTHRNVNSHSLGVEGLNAELGRLENVILIPKNTPLPCERKELFATDRATADDGADLAFRILEGEAVDPEACVAIGECRVEDLPSGLCKDTPVEVTFSYGEDGRIHVSAAVRDVGLSATARIYCPDALDEAGLQENAAAVAAMEIL